MDIWTLVTDPHRRRFAAVPESDALRDRDAMLESQLQRVSMDAVRSTVALLFDCKGALQIRAGNTGVLIARGLRSFSWRASPDYPRLAWVVLGWEPGFDGEVWTLTASIDVGAQLEIAAADAEFYVGDVPGCDAAQPNYLEATEAELDAGVAQWSSEFEPIHASFLTPELGAR